MSMQIDGGLGRGVDYETHGARVEERVEVLRDEGRGFDINGTLLQGTLLASR